MPAAPRVKVVTSPLQRKALAEAVGTGGLVTVVVGSGIMAEQLAPAEAGFQLLANSTATALGLVALILAFGPVSGAHLNPAVTLGQCLDGKLGVRTAAAYVTAQATGACGGAVLANVMFERPTFELATTDRLGTGTFVAEVVATAGLLLVIAGVLHSARLAAVPIAVSSYIGAAYWFTSSTSIANPAATAGRMLSDSFAGVRPASALGFVLAQLIGVGIAVAFGRALFPDPDPSLEEALDAGR